MQSSEEMIIVERLLSDKNFKMTSVRRVVVQFFLNHRGHYKPEAIYQRLRKQQISVASLYRTLDVLKQINFIREISLDNINYYELLMFSQKQLHIHFYCKQCQRVIDYYNESINDLMLQQSVLLEKNYHDDIQSFEIVLNGLCRHCKEE
jgi:Fe2+ or Zn2+ uptake regulation protein